MTLVVRTAADPLKLAGVVRDQVRSVDRGVVVTGVRTMGQLVSQSAAPRQFNMTLLGVFAALALVLAAVGVYGVISYSVTQRTREIGIRLALGATAGDVRWLILRQGMAVALIGVGLGLAGALALTRVTAGLLFGVSPSDPLTYAGVTVLLACIALVACYVPARRATRVNPVVALRCE